MMDTFTYTYKRSHHCITIFFFFNDTATTEIYTLSLHDALPIFVHVSAGTERLSRARDHHHANVSLIAQRRDRKSTRLNSSHLVISYAVFCLKKKNNHHQAENASLIVASNS